MSTHNNGFYIYDPRDSAVEYYKIGDDQANGNYYQFHGIYITTDHKNHNNLWLGNADGIFFST
jgi:hypothetical protein